MKRIVSCALCAALVAALFTGCGCMDRNISTHPGGMITEEPTILPHPTATHETTTPTHATHPAEPTAPTGTMTEPNLPTGETTAPTTEPRARMNPSVR